jgi:hypothetical protein
MASRVDLPGAGKSDAPRTGYDKKTMAADDVGGLPGRTSSIAEGETRAAFLGRKRAGATMGGASGREGRPVFWRKARSWLSVAFALNPSPGHSPDKTRKHRPDKPCSQHEPG